MRSLPREITATNWGKKRTKNWLPRLTHEEQGRYVSERCSALAVEPERRIVQGDTYIHTCRPRRR